MKYIYKSFRISVVVAMLSLTLTNCADLTESNLGTVSPVTYFQDHGSVEAAVSNVYAGFNAKWDGYHYWGPHFMSGSDVSQSGDGWGYLRDFVNLSLKTDNNAVKKVWIVHYDVIKAANLALVGIDQVDESEVSSDDKKEYRAQVYFGRALAYFNLVRWWGDVPMFTVDNIADVTDISRTDVATVYELIVNDLKYAEQYLQVDYPGQPGMPTEGAAKSLLAKVYLTMAGWPLKSTDKYALAAAKAKEVMTSGNYDLFTNCSDLWVEANNNGIEHIFSFQFVSNTESGSTSHGNQYIGQALPAVAGDNDNGWSEFYAEQDYYDTFPDGPRKEATFIVDWNGTHYTDFPVPFPHCKKYIDRGNGAKKESSFNLPVLRYADVLLIFAEAQNQAKGAPDTEAYSAINRVRSRAGLADLPSGLSKDDFDTAVLNERKWELGFEINRWFDLQRKELVLKVNDGKPGLTIDDMLFPIPQREIDVIGPTLVQNPGY